VPSILPATSTPLRCAPSSVFAPLRYVPPEKLVVLELVTSKRSELERKDAKLELVVETAAEVWG
jgi:hypothetical protein